MPFSTSVVCAVSSLEDGSMSTSVPDGQRFENRRKFLVRNTVTAEQAVLVRLAYDGDNYCRYSNVSNTQAGDGIVYPSSIIADALFTTSKNLALLLPVADCIGSVLYDPVRQVLGLSHLGRHNLLQDGGTKSITYMVNNFGSVPADIQVWLSPAAGRANYPLFDYGNRSLVDVASQQLLSAGIRPDNIDIDVRDTTIDDGLFSHSEFLKGKRASDGRQMVVCMMRA